MWTALSAQRIQRRASAISNSKRSSQQYLGTGAAPENDVELHPVPRGSVGQAFRAKEDFRPACVQNRRSRSPLRDRESPARFETASTDVGSLSVWNAVAICLDLDNNHMARAKPSKRLVARLHRGSSSCVPLQEAAEIPHLLANMSGKTTDEIPSAELDVLMKHAIAVVKGFYFATRPFHHRKLMFPCISLVWDSSGPALCAHNYHANKHGIIRVVIRLVLSCFHSWIAR